MEYELISYGNLCSYFYDATEKYALEVELSFYSQIIQQHGGGRVLEAMSGSGRLQIPLTLKGFVVDGVDISPMMLARCRERCKNFNINPETYHQSVVDLELPHTYSVVTIAVGSLQLILDQADALRALKKIHAHMVRGGSLVVDTFTPNFHDEQRLSTVARIDEHTLIRLTTRYMIDQSTQIADSYCFFEKIVDGRVVECENELIQVVWRTQEQWIELFNAAGFELVAIYNESFRVAGPSIIYHLKAT